jgi:hypothetical protein
MVCAPSRTAVRTAVRTPVRLEQRESSSIDAPLGPAARSDQRRSQCEGNRAHEEIVDRGHDPGGAARVLDGERHREHDRAGRWVPHRGDTTSEWRAGAVAINTSDEQDHATVAVRGNEPGAIRHHDNTAELLQRFRGHGPDHHRRKTKALSGLKAPHLRCPAREGLRAGQRAMTGAGESALHRDRWGVCEVRRSTSTASRRSRVLVSTDGHGGRPDLLRGPSRKEE